MAAAKVFDIAELFEIILCYVPAVDLIVAQRTNQHFEATIQASPRLQQMLFLPSPLDCRLQRRWNHMIFRQEDQLPDCEEVTESEQEANHKAEPEVHTAFLALRRHTNIIRTVDPQLRQRPALLPQCQLRIRQNFQAVLLSQDVRYAASGNTARNLLGLRRRRRSYAERERWDQNPKRLRRHIWRGSAQSHVAV